MSFGGSGGRSRSSAKGSKEKKSAKKRKQEFHRPKRRVIEEEKADVEVIKERTVSALEHLGQQRFSGEPGAYGMQNWVKSLGQLLEDFESKLQESDLPPEYSQRKGEILANLSKPPEDSESQKKIEALRTEEVEIRNKLDKEADRISARTVEVRNETERQTKDLDAERMKLDQLNQEREQVSFFSKLVGKRGPSTKPVEERIAELKSLLDALESERGTLVSARESMERHPGAGSDPYGGDWKRLEEVGEGIAKLEAAVQERAQRAQERADATAQLVVVIRAIKSKQPTDEPSA